MKLKNQQGKKIGAQLLIVLFFLLGANLLYHRRRPERLIPIEGPAFMQETIHNGQLYRLRSNQPDEFPVNIGAATDEVIDCQTVVGGPVHEIVRLPPNVRLNSGNDPLTVTHGFLVYSVVPQQTGQSVGSLAGAASATTIHYLGQFLPRQRMLTPEELAREKRRGFPKKLDPQQKLYLQRVSLQGGAAQTFLTVDQGSRLCFQPGQNAYWIRRRPEDHVQITRGNEQWDEIVGQSDLMVTSLADGVTQRLCTGLTLGTLLVAGTEGVFWTQSHPFPDPAQDLCYYQANDHKIHIIYGFDGKLDRNSPAEFHGRLYWFTYAPPKTGNILNGYYAGDPNTLQSLVSANKDGSDRRLELDLSRLNWLAFPIQLVAHHDCLYCVHSVSTATTTLPGDHNLVLCRIHPGQANPIEECGTFPGVSQLGAFDEHYYYFVTYEMQRSLWQTLTDDNVNVPTRPVLYRVSLPE
jgi:hypothetical protein